jgi:hypothetical protein
MSKINRSRKIFWGVVGILAAILVVFSLVGRGYPERFLRNAIPDGADIAELNSQTFGLAGDYVVMAKIRMSQADFNTFTAKLKLESKISRSVNPMAESVDWWVTPEVDDMVFFKSGKGFQIWLFYADGYAFYCDRGW